MSVKNANDGLLTNHEVMELIRERKQQRVTWAQQQTSASSSGNSTGTGVGTGAGNVSKIDLQHRSSVEIKTTNYISRTKVGKLSTAQLRSCLSKIKALQLGLSEHEMITMANHLPESDVEYYLMIENNRLSEEQIAALKEVIAAYSPVAESSANE